MRLLRVVGKRFSKNRLSVIGMTVVLCLMTVSLLAPIIAPYDPTTIDVYNVLSSPSRTHFLGTDELGRDLFSRIIWGSRVSLKVGIVAVGIAIVIGIIIGSVSGFYGGKVDAVLMRFVDIMLAFPTFFSSLRSSQSLSRASLP